MGVLVFNKGLRANKPSVLSEGQAYMEIDTGVLWLGTGLGYDMPITGREYMIMQLSIAIQSGTADPIVTGGMTREGDPLDIGLPNTAERVSIGFNRFIWTASPHVFLNFDSLHAIVTNYTPALGNAFHFSAVMGTDRINLRIYTELGVLQDGYSCSIVLLGRYKRTVPQTVSENYKAIDQI